MPEINLQEVSTVKATLPSSTLNMGALNQ